MALYPPIVASSMPAFGVQEGKGKVRIYYSLSTYNVAKIDKIRAVHITVRRQSSNVNVLREPGQILSKPFPGDRDEIDIALNRYYVEISNNDLLEEEPYFQVDALYKVQLRFSSSSDSANFFTNDIDNFSEWSTVCIIKPIQVPIFYIDEFHLNDDSPPEQTDINNFYSTLSDFTGVYKQQNSLEALKSWRLRLLSNSYNKDNILSIENYVLSDSGWILNSANNYNTNDNSVVLACSLPYELKQNIIYKLLFEIKTKNGYESNILYTFICNNQSINTLVGELKSYINEKEGYVKLTFSSSENDIGNLVIRRTDARSNFLKWEDLKFLEYHDIINFVYYDFTVQSGTFYRYLIQKVDARGRRGTPLYDSSRANGTGIMVEWEHPFLLQSTGNGDLEGTKQLKLKYDFQISSYKTNVSESKTDTIGSKYPYIRRNGNMYYRSFPITGTITQFMDEANLFTSSQILFNNKYEQYQVFKGQIGNYGVQYDYTYERKFREKVEEFLYNSKPKLYKSMQQGNIFIKLMQVSLTPKNELGRLVYSFSATAYEIDEPIINTFNNYGLITVGTFNPNISYQTTVMGQISSFDFNDNIEGNIFKAGQDIIGAGQGRAAANSIAKKIKYREPFNNKIVTGFNINWLRLTIESEPYLIIEDGGVFRPFDDVIPSYTEKNPNYIDKNIIRNNNIESIRNNRYEDNIDQPIDYQLYQIESTYNGTNVYLGWLFTINGQQIIISPPNNIYEIKDDLFIYNQNFSVIPAKDTAMLVDYRLVEVRQEDLTNLPKNIRIDKVNGQLMGTYSQDTQLISRINYKYKYTYESGSDRVERKVNGVQNVSIDTEPGTIVYIKTSEMDQTQRFVINHTGEFTFDPMDSNIFITQLKIVGINVNLEDTNDKGVVQELSDIVYPKEGDRCKINNQNYFFYRSDWHKATLTENEQFLDVSCPIDALVFYYAAIKESYF